MRDVYVEWLVSKKRSLGDKAVRVISMTISVLTVLLFSVTFNLIVFLIALAAIGFTYFAFGFTDVEYEYVFITGEFAIDRILSKSRRKRIEKIDVNHIQIVAPLKSARLGGFEHRKVREYDYTSGVRTPGSHIFVMYTEDKRILFEPNKEMFDAMKDVLPHKVHLN